MDEHFVPVEWSYNTNIYEVNLRQYTTRGTFKAFEGELQRLAQMGVEVLWFMPITPISVAKRLGTLGSYYACSSYTTTNPEFGSVEDFKSVVDHAHALGMKVIIDWVANHTGYDHVWTFTHPDFYRRNAEGQFFDAHGWNDVIDLNYDNRALWKTMIESMRFWIDSCNIDGFRCDMAMLVPLAFWHEARTTLDQLKPLFWLAECEEIDYHKVFDATYAWKLLHAFEAFWKKEKDLNFIEEVLNFYRQNFPPHAMRALFITNHDENSHSGSEYERMGDAVIPFTVLCATWNGLPLIYSGQELPNKRRLKFFDKDEIPWTGEYKLASFFQTLLELRKRNRALRTGDEVAAATRMKTNADDKLFAFIRAREQDAVLVILNLSPGEIAGTLQTSIPAGTYRDVFSKAFTSVDTSSSFTLPAWSFIILERTH